MKNSLSMRTERKQVQVSLSWWETQLYKLLQHLLQLLIPILLNSSKVFSSMEWINNYRVAESTESPSLFALVFGKRVLGISIVVQKVSPTHVTLASHMAAGSRQSLLHDKAMKDGHSAQPPAPMWEIRMKLLAPVLGLAQPQLLRPFA